MIAKVFSVALPLIFAGKIALAEPGFESEFCKNKQNEIVDPAHVEKEIGIPAAKFAVALMAKLAPENPGNFVASPYSIATTLEMALAGARGETATEMASAISLKGVPTGDSFRRRAGYLRFLTCAPDWRRTKLYTANRIYVAKDKVLLPGFLKTLKDAFDITAGEIDYKRHAEEGRKEINAWVEQATAGKIKELLAPRSLTPDTKLTLVNALYVKGHWRAPFEKQDTKPQAFHLDLKHEENVPTMHHKGLEEELSFVAMKGYRVVSLPFDDRVGALALFVPDEVEGLKKMETALDGAGIVDALSQLKMRRVNLSMPKFKVETGFDLKKTLVALGMQRAFEQKKADFGGIDDGKDQLFVGLVVHKAFLSVDEDGLEAAAATAMGMDAGGMPTPTKPVDVKVDRPFMFVVYEPMGKTPLFIGRVLKP